MWLLYAFLWFISLAIVAGGVLLVQQVLFRWILRGKDRLAKRRARLDRQQNDLRRKEHALQRAEEAIQAFDARKVQYSNLQAENDTLKQDLFNLHVKMKKIELDEMDMHKRQLEIRKLADEMAAKYLDENVDWITQKITAANFTKSKKRLLKAIEVCREIGCHVSSEREAELLNALQQGFEKACRIEYEREEQARIKERIREERRLEAEIAKEIKRLDREREAIRVALEKALQEAADEHSAEIERLRERLREAEERSTRAKSRAEMTRAGYVYVISNIGSFGENVFKIGMSRRLTPLDRVRELGDASVPFPFDVHMMISSEDAPTLEKALHRDLHKHRTNKVNSRKEFFGVDLETIHRLVETHHGEVEYVVDPEAREYRESMEMSEEDSAFVAQTMEALMAGEEDPVE